MCTSNVVFDVLVIGAGQAGLALGHQLSETGLRFLLVDRHERVGDSWRERFDSLMLFTPRAYSALPGLSMPGDPDGYPTKDELADYLEAYVRHFAMPVALNTGIERLEQASGMFRATTTAGAAISARAVVLATGAFQETVVPPLSRLFSDDVAQLTANGYRNPRHVPPGSALVVGDGATGRQIARELSATHHVLLATGRRRRVSPDRVLGRSVFWWMDKLGILRTSGDSLIGRYLKRADPFPGKDLELGRLRERGVTVAGRLCKAAGRRITLASGEQVEVDVVIWATGYRDRSDWVEIPEAVDPRGAFVHEHGLSPVQRLYFIGRSWQRSRGSALVTGVGADAAHIARQIVRDLGSAHASGAVADLHAALITSAQ